MEISVSSVRSQNQEWRGEVEDRPCEEGDKGCFFLLTSSILGPPYVANYFTVELTVLKAITLELADLFGLAPQV